VGVALSGNIAGLTAEALAALDAPSREALRRDAADQLHRAGAHLVVDSIADLPAVVEQLEARLAAGEVPGLRDGH
jgi:phosphonoacetaldehyde hydrolase